MPLPLSKRVKAARGAADMNLDDFADAIGVGRSTLIRTEAGTRQPDETELRRIAKASGLPLAFFVVEDLDQVLDGYEEPTLTTRIETLERDFRRLRTNLVALSAESLQRTRGAQEPNDSDRSRERPGEGR